MLLSTQNQMAFEPAIVCATQFPEHLVFIPEDAQLNEAVLVGRGPTPKRSDSERENRSRANVILSAAMESEKSVYFSSFSR